MGKIWNVGFRIYQKMGTQNLLYNLGHRNSPSDIYTFE